jgi:hypothetical protein
MVVDGSASSGPVHEFDVLRMRLIVLQHATYEDYLRSDEWRARREAWVASHPGTGCFVCGRGPPQLHHATYVRLGMEHDDDLVPLCDDHHEQVHIFAGPKSMWLGKAHLLARKPHFRAIAEKLVQQRRAAAADREKRAREGYKPRQRGTQARAKPPGDDSDTSERAC